jgi:enoyl-CoA hydratase/carnithine racemase
MQLPSGLVSLTVEDRIATVRLNRPESLNAISSALAEELAEVMWEVRHDPNVWVVVLAAVGEKAFCVGADLKERASFGIYDFYRNREQMRLMFSSIRRISQPIIASVFGFALGGGFELALSCDLIVAADDATFGLPEVSVGLLPAGGGTQLLTRKIGVARAKDMILRARRISALEAQEMGLLSDLTTRDGLEARTLEVAREICRVSPVAARESKEAIDAALGTPLEQGMEIEQMAWRRVISSDDRAEGISAFNEKRDPNWTNR